MTRLAELQARFWRLITAPEPASRALPGLAAADPSIAPLSGWIRATSEAEAGERLDVYANMYFFRLLDVLRDDYPKLSALVGPDSFHNLVTGYLLAHPSDNPSLRWIGRHLAAYLDASPLDRYPGASSLARLEWARGEAFDSADAASVGIDALRNVGPDRFPGMRLELQPALRLVETSHRVVEQWLALERGADTIPEAAPGPGRVVVWRQQFQVFHRSVTVAEWTALRAAADGATFAEMCERLWEHAGDRTAETAVRTVRGWLESGLVAAIEPS